MAQCQAERRYQGSFLGSVLHEVLFNVFINDLEDGTEDSFNRVPSADLLGLGGRHFREQAGKNKT